ncbi:hypothetical protein DIPPA_19423 [Diplonema papillatum]|nr:hypothetical protein DIPPA_14314 [Diplonema papillatum]KAJ9440410.1 hypothetical protein DIPPA_19423 [Diplonema papillatum]
METFQVTLMFPPTGESSVEEVFGTATVGMLKKAALLRFNLKSLDSFALATAESGRWGSDDRPLSELPIGDGDEVQVLLDEAWLAREALESRGDDVSSTTGLAVALEKYAAAGDVPSLELLKLLGVRDVHCAALRAGREPALALARDLPTVQWLVGHGGRVHYEYGNGTPFNKAVQRGDHALVAYMKSLG